MAVETSGLPRRDTDAAVDVVTAVLSRDNHAEERRCPFCGGDGKQRRRVCVFCRGRGQITW